ncbi:OmpA family protein [Niveibacterium sp.]|uniref:OmpA family protein n=1 Tax=Niveibacterium sp. TaxID=2017444 RepID=UPI0035B48ED1
MQPTRLTCLLAGASIALGACATMDESSQEKAKGAGLGALGGAAAGALIGAVTGSDKVGRDAAIGAAVGAAGGYIWSSHMEKQKREMEKATAGTGVSVSQTSDNQLKLEVPGDFSFDTGRADIKPNMRPVLDRFATTLNENRATHIRIIGHTDNTGSDAVNDPLSLNRAASTRDYLADRGVASNRISIDGRGERNPIASNDTAEGRARNRRVEIFVAEAAAR